ncbi:MAG: YigZ family protein [Acutalibacteraceae bacterium]|nr:YigZ family protein [Acutalibacteraceae bacterium]
MDSYLTVKNDTSDQFIERKSRFIGYIRPVTTETDAIAFVSEIRKKHPDATHNVYAYILRENNKQRYSDDGEPQGTAGLPVLEVLKREGLTDVAVVATRYFGGILLGGGGLVRAYAHTAKIAVDAGVPVKMSLCDLCKVQCGYDMYSTVTKLLEKFNAAVTDTRYTDIIEINFHIECNQNEKLHKEFAELTAGRIDFEKQGEKYMPLSINL